MGDAEVGQTSESVRTTEMLELLTMVKNPKGRLGILT